ncbi:outer membrane beta-barrel protein [Hydrogenophaga flava]|uniref:outer membrane beta-barrel protein n=1 Tax=Hydrogenophaga flava TaxID=65657 RepID=UPI0008252AAA|nr:outer membrane beta-barrel protein [Hydrogenophaga flava]
MTFKPLALAALLAAATTPAAMAQSVYGELGYSALSMKLSVPVIGLRASANPAMIRGLVGLQITDGLALEAIGAVNSGSSAYTNSNNGTRYSGKIDQLYGLYVAPKIGLGPVELFGRVGMARTKLSFQGLGSGEDKKLSYGGGLRLMPTSNLSLSVDYMNYLDSGGASVNGYSLSLGLRF